VPRTPDSAARGRAALCAAALAVGAVTGVAGCGAQIPERLVLERDLGPWSYRRYQRVLDVELPIADNPSESRAATYLRRDGDGGQPGIATAVVTRYAQGDAVAAEIRDALDTLGTYEIDVVEREGAWMFALEGAAGDRWVLWVSGRYAVKLGAPRGAPGVPGWLVRAYLDPYPSDLDQHGRAREGTGSAGLSRRQRDERESDLDLPPSLRENPPPDAEDPAGGDDDDDANRR